MNKKTQKKVAENLSKFQKFNYLLIGYLRVNPPPSKLRTVHPLSLLGVFWHFFSFYESLCSRLDVILTYQPLHSSHYCSYAKKRCKMRKERTSPSLLSSIHLLFLNGPCRWCSIVPFRGARYRYILNPIAEQSIVDLWLGWLLDCTQYPQILRVYHIQFFFQSSSLLGIGFSHKFVVNLK